MKRQRQQPPQQQPSNTITKQVLSHNDDRETIDLAIKHHKTVLWPSKLSFKGDQTVSTRSTAFTSTSTMTTAVPPNKHRNLASCVFATLLVVFLFVVGCVVNSDLRDKVSDFFFRQVPDVRNDTSPSKELWQGMENYNIILAPVLENNFANVTHMSVNAKITPFFLKVPKSGGNVISLVMTKCFHMVEASDAGKEHEDDKKLLVYTNERVSKSGPLVTKFVNVDTSTVQGIGRARFLNLVPSDLADVVISSFLYEAAPLFDSPVHVGSAFVLVRHPVHRAESIYRQMSSDMDISEYFSPGSGQYVEDNFMVRTLTNQQALHLTEDDLLLAMDVLRRKFLVCLVEEIEESVERLRKYFKWHSQGGNDKEVNDCIVELMRPVTEVQKKRTKLVEGSADWNIIMTYNRWDLQLYEYALILYEQQGNMFKIMM